MERGIALLYGVLVLLVHEGCKLSAVCLKLLLLLCGIVCVVGISAAGAGRKEHGQHQQNGKYLLGHDLFPLCCIFTLCRKAVLNIITHRCLAGYKK